MVKTSFVLALALVVAGCSGYTTGFFPYGDLAVPARDPRAPVELFRGNPEDPHREIGEVFAEGASLEDLAGIRAALIDKAASIGADAVKLVRVGTSWQGYGYYAAGFAYAEPWPCYGGWGGWGGWYGGYPAYYGGGVRRTILVRGIAIIWGEPGPGR